ncbi:hypothetical protein QT971_30115 [Microcoleus sp. herbarium19]
MLSVIVGSKLSFIRSHHRPDTAVPFPYRRSLIIYMQHYFSELL